MEKKPELSSYWPAVQFPTRTFVVHTCLHFCSIYARSLCSQLHVRLVVVGRWLCGLRGAVGHRRSQHVAEERRARIKPICRAG